MPGRIDIARTQLTDQQVATAEDIERQIAVVIVIAIEEAILLVAVKGRVGSIEVQDQPLGWLIVSGYKLVEQHLVDGHDGFSIGTLFQPAQGGGTGE